MTRTVDEIAAERDATREAEKARKAAELELKWRKWTMVRDADGTVVRLEWEAPLDED